MGKSKQDYSAGDVVEASDLNIISDNASRGSGMDDASNAGETINGATLPVPIFIKQADGEIYACDANDQERILFDGFAITNSTNGNPISIQTSGVVPGFTGLTKGAKYYVQDAVGTIGTTPGTYKLLVGVAISATEILILKESWELIGTDVISGSNASGVASDTSAIPMGTKFILYDVSGYKSEGGSYGYATLGQILLMPGIITVGYCKSENVASGSSATDIYGVKASISGTTLTCETVKITGGGGATAYIAGTVYYFK